MPYSNENLRDIFKKLIDIVDINGKIIGQATYDLAHKTGLRHQTVQVFFLIILLLKICF